MSGFIPSAALSRTFSNLRNLAVNRRGPPPVPCAELGIHGLNSRTKKKWRVLTELKWFSSRTFAGGKSGVAGVELATASELPARQPRTWGRRRSGVDPSHP